MNEQVEGSPKPWRQVHGSVLDADDQWIIATKADGRRLQDARDIVVRVNAYEPGGDVDKLVDALQEYRNGPSHFVGCQALSDSEFDDCSAECQKARIALTPFIR